VGRKGKKGGRGYWKVKVKGKKKKSGIKIKSGTFTETIT